MYFCVSFESYDEYQDQIISNMFYRHNIWIKETIIFQM